MYCACKHLTDTWLTPQPEKHCVFIASAVLLPQADCLMMPKVERNRCNLVISAPTGSGKSAVAHALILRTVAQTHKFCIFVTPYVKICDEQVHRLQPVFDPLNK